ncbi:hypothetical protein Halru_1562 [Halovivax ruber XH-70]|uniref:KaiC-like domain-containing protein n=1 Tax=Halovivax ruber (strain DSM 18193 / JCM 13892 / XH-70) TaxID=797302 RepID=L0IBM8_HALRX|nr:hypothetical protein [Halovivax ruber]AGB16169.1 hypothetical protein Halru_1562 [Halovivax ruber XH-70]
MGSELGVGVPERSSFVQELGTLKRNGSNVLLVGEPAAASHGHVCSRFLGAGESTTHRLVVSTDRSRIPADRPSQTQYFLLDPDRTAAEPTEEDHIRVLPTLGTVGLEFGDRIDRLESRTDLGPASLRVCVDSVADLLAAYDSEVVFRLLHVLSTRTRRSRGMGHYHLPIERESEAVRLFEPLFDAVVTLRSTDDTVEHRWHLRDSETPTEWLPL